MSEEKKDRELGMKCPISRRDFLNGVAVGVGVGVGVVVVVGEGLGGPSVTVRRALAGHCCCQHRLSTWSPAAVSAGIVTSCWTLP